MNWLHIFSGLGFVIESCLFFLVVDVLAWEVIAQYATYGNIAIALAWYGLVTVSLLCGVIVGIRRNLSYINGKGLPLTPSGNISLREEIWPIIKLTLKLYAWGYGALMLKSWREEAFLGPQLWLLFSVHIVALAVKYYQLRSRLALTRYDLYLLVVVPVLALSCYFIQDSLPALRNNGDWKRYYSASQLRDQKIIRRLNKMFRSAATEQEMDNFWNTYGVKGLPYVVKCSDDLYASEAYKEHFACNMILQIDDPVFIPELKKIMFKGLVGSAARYVLFQMNTPFTKEELIEFSRMPEYVSPGYINPSFEREINKLSPHDLADIQEKIEEIGDATR